MDEILQETLSLQEEKNRGKFPLQWKAEGKKVVGLLCSYVPEEIIHAAGMLPWRIFGTQKADTPSANLYRPAHMCLYCNHVLESLLGGQYDFLDAVVATSWDQDLVRLWDVWKYLGKSNAHYILHLPLSHSPIHKERFAREVGKFFEFIQRLSGREIRPDDLFRSITLYNRARTLLHRLYEFRKLESPPLSGAEVLGITTASLLMPVETRIETLERILSCLQQREALVGRKRPRLLISSDRLDNPALLEVVEGVGSLVAMDDLDTGSRSFWKFTDPCNPDSIPDMLKALADRYHSQPASPAMMNWSDQVAQVALWVQEFNVAGIIEFPLLNSRSRQMRAPYFKQKLVERGIPVVSFEREYHLANVGQLKTRVGAFVEMLQFRA
jgi:benzoyl-CoA reductase subunit C